ncbi:phosphodiester glycosidase family protein [Streptomyces sp. LX-29]|uniref:phosphodiester glycosidase family protein n=1 Tax=Streptomyces sp. LX-29 TaxID=2900152 RepID=UPI00240E8952|nr:phosphodiester glycosidase family protein [Streptomyces sp. LX-29]WFB11116.1 phosphodiester glycosidase family protein [Streptomyces sp. LX-29]
MTRHRRLRRLRRTVAAGTAWVALVGGGLAGATPARGAPNGLRQLTETTLAPGVDYRRFAVSTPHGTAYGHLLTVDLRTARTASGLLYPDAVGARAPVTRLADARGAVAAVNGDFFNITEVQHPGVEATGAPVGPAVAGGRVLKGAVPRGQRFGPALPPGASVRDVIGVGTDRRARVDRLSLRGTVRTPRGELRLRGLNQYAVAVDGVGAFTSAWGTTSRVRATCGTDTDRSAPCSTETREVTVRRGRVTAVARTPGKGAIASDTVVLVGREAGARALRGLRVGDPVRTTYTLKGTQRTPFDFAVGGYPIARDGRPLEGLDAVTTAVRTGAGVGRGGRLLHLLALDGRAEYRSGLTIAELAEVMLELGARDVVNLDGGGSSTLVTRAPGGTRTKVRNHPSGGSERPVPNGIGVFTRS